MTSTPRTSDTVEPTKATAPDLEVNRHPWCPSSCTDHQDHGDAQMHVTHIFYGAVHWDGSRSHVDIQQAEGRGVLLQPTKKELRTKEGRQRRRTIECNPWTSGKPFASALTGSLDADGCKAAAAALLAAADLIEDAR